MAIEFIVVDSPEFEEQFRLGVEACTDAIEHGSEMLAYRGPVGAVAVESDLPWVRKRPPSLSVTTALISSKIFPSRHTSNS